MSLRHSATWWSLFMLPAVLLPINLLAGLILLAAMAYATYRSP